MGSRDWTTAARRLIRWAGYTPTDVARLLGVSPPYLHRLLEAPLPPRKAVLALGSVLDLPAAEMTALCQAADVRPPRDASELAEARQLIGMRSGNGRAFALGWTAY